MNTASPSNLVPYADDSSVAAFFREKLSNWVLRISGQFSFLMISDFPDDDRDCCTGTIIVIANKQGQGAIKKVKSRLRSVEKEQLSQDELAEIASSDSCYKVEFQLERNGKLTISAPPQQDEITTIDGVLANQVFYFVKDIAHVHQHRDPKHDSITEMSPINSDDEIWKAQTSYSLYRSIIRYKRFRSEKALFRASGVLACTKAFQTNYPIDQGAKRFSHEELEQSLAVSRAELQHFD